jgi:hypothetical protein
MRKRTLTIATVLVALAASLTLGFFRGTRKVQAQSQEPPTIASRTSFGLVSLTQGQTARLNVANVIADNDEDFPRGSTRVTINFVNGHGDLFRGRDGTAVRRVVMLARGESTELDLNTDDFALGAGGRIQLRAVVVVHPPPTPDRISFPPDPCVPTFEVVNNATGRTVFALSALPAVQRLNATSVSE